MEELESRRQANLIDYVKKELDKNRYIKKEVDKDKKELEKDC
jgi:hypothetical protein